MSVFRGLIRAHYNRMDKGIFFKFYDRHFKIITRIMNGACVCVLSFFSCVRRFVILWTVAHQAPLSMGFSRQGYWSELLCPPPGNLPNRGLEPVSLMSPAMAGKFFITSTTWEWWLVYRYIRYIHQIYQISRNVIFMKHL